MTLDLKTTIIASSLLAGVLNVAQFGSAYMAKKDGFIQTWNYQSAPDKSPEPATLAMTQAKSPALSQTPAANPAPVAVTAATAPAPATSPTVDDVAAKLSKAGLKPTFAALYLSAQDKTGTPWQILAAVHQVETGGSGNTTRKSSAGATGPMQFMPATFARYALDGDGNGTADITDVDDAILTAGRYLAAGGAAKGNYTSALYNYNHSNTYVSNVMTIVHRLGL